MAVNILGLVGCIVGATATSVDQLIGANGCNGIAAAGQLSFGIILGELVPNKQRGPIVTLVFFSSMPFAVFGPVIARSFILNTSSGWRWSYYLGIILEVITLVLYQFAYHPPKFSQLHENKTKWQAFRELDFGGIFLFVSGFVVLIIGLSWGGSAYPWKSAEVISTMVVGGVLIIAFVVYGKKSIPHTPRCDANDLSETFIFKGVPLMPPRLFRNVGYVAVVACATIAAMVYYAMTIIWPTAIGALYSTDIMEIGWQSCLVGGCVLLGQIIGGFSLSYVPKVKFQAIVAAAIGGGFISSLATISPTTHTASLVQGFLGLMFVGIIDNITFPAVTLLWEPQDIGLATGVLGSIRGMGGAIAQSLYVTILTNKATTLTAKYVPAAAIGAGLPESSLTALFGGLATGDFSAVPGITDKIIAAVGAASQHAYSGAFRVVFLATIPFTVLLVIGACFIPDMEKFLHNNVAKKLQGKGIGKSQHASADHDVEKA